MELSRREFIQTIIAAGIGAEAAGVLLSLFGCRSEGGTASTPGPSTLPSPEAPAQTPVPSRSLPAASTTTPPPGLSSSGTYLAVARGKSPTALVQAAIKALGGIGHFVRPGNEVIVKPNICVAYHTYEYAATTNPEVVSAIVALCLGAGAKRLVTVP